MAEGKIDSSVFLAVNLRLRDFQCLLDLTEIGLVEE